MAGMTEMDPTPAERRLVYRCFLHQMILLGNEEEIWSVPDAWRMLNTLRSCVSGIEALTKVGFPVTPDGVMSATLLQVGVGPEPFHLADMAVHLCEDDEARLYWQTQLNDEKFPHRCPNCGAAAYVGFNQVDCRARCR